MSAFDVGLLVWVAVLFAVVPLSMLAILAPGAIPWGARGRAARQLEAMKRWRVVDSHERRAAGYFAARDYLGVESAYLAARRIVDGESQP